MAQFHKSMWKVENGENKTPIAAVCLFVQDLCVTVEPAAPNATLKVDMLM